MTKLSFILLTVITAITFIISYSPPCLAGVIGGGPGISSGSFTNIDISAANSLINGVTDAVIITGTLNNNYTEGFKITFSTGAGSASAFGFQGTGNLAAITGTTGDFVQVTSLKINSTGGTVGHATSWSDSVVSIPTASLGQDMNSGTQTVATENETIEIKATTPSKTTLLKGSYTLDLAVTYTNLGI